MNRANLSRNLVGFLILLGLSLGLAGCATGHVDGHQLAPPPPANSEYLFAASNNEVWSFSVNTTTGALGTGVSVTGPGLSYGTVGDPGGKFLYVSDSGTDQVHVFSISSSGTLSEILGSLISVGTPSPTTESAAGLAMDSGGKYLYATDLFNNDVAGFTVNSSTGALTAANGSPFATGATPVQVVVDASSQFVYVSDSGSGIFGGVSAFTLTSGSGMLTPVPGSSPFDTVPNGEPFGLATTGQFLYVTERAAGGVAGLSITSGTGGLGPLPDSPYATGQLPTGVVVSSSGKYLYAANYQDSTISEYSVDASGALTAIGAPLATTAQPWYLAIDPSGKFLYATNPANNTITGFTINSSSGALTQFSGSATMAGTQPVSLTVVTVP